MSQPDTLEEMIADIVLRMLPSLALAGAHTYRVQAVHDGGRCDLVSVKEGPPDLPNVDQWPGGPGGQGVPAVDSFVVVTFLDGNPNTPTVTAYQPLRVNGGKPVSTTLDATTVKIGPTATTVEIAGGGAAVGRVGDSVQCGSFSAVGVAVGVPIQFVYTPFGSAPLPPAPAVAIIGEITSGSGKVSSG